MRKIYKKLKANSKQINEANELYEATNESVYYDVFSSEESRQADLNACLQSQKELLNAKHTLLGNMLTAIRRELAKTSLEYQTLKIKEICVQKQKLAS